MKNFIWTSWTEETNNLLIEYRKQDVKYKQIKKFLNYPHEEKSLRNHYSILTKDNKENTSKILPEKKLSMQEKIVYEKQITTLNAQCNDIRNKYKILLKEVSLQDKVVNLITDKIESIPSTNEYKKIKKTSKKQEVEESVLLLGDLHIGEDVDPNQIGGLGEYNFTTFLYRLQHLSNVINKLVTNHLSNYNLKKLWVLGLGDFISGCIHEELVESSSTTVVDWVFGGAVVLAQFLRDMCAIFPQVEFVGVVGNHGRLKKKPQFKNRHLNWDYILYQMLSGFTKEQKNLTFDIPKSFFTLRKINKHNFLILHGDNIRMYNQVPFYGINRTVARFTELMASKRQFINYVTMGHFHNMSTLDNINGEKIINGSMIGGNEFSIGALTLGDDPKQLFFGVHEKMGISWRFPINLKFAPINSELRYNYDSNLTVGSQI